MNSFFEKNKKYIEGRSFVVNVLLLCVTFWIGFEANDIANKQNQFTKQQNIISDTQTEILQQQTDILDRQTDIQNNALDFDKEKHSADVMKDYRDQMNSLFDKITGGDPTLTAVHDKIMTWSKIDIQKNLDKYVNEFENIWALYCDGKIKLADLRTILKNQLSYVCWNEQIYHYYQNTKSGISWMCSVLFPKSTVMAKYVNLSRCPILK